MRLVEHIKARIGRFFCPHPDWAILDRFKWDPISGEGVYYQECDICGKEFYD